MEKAILLFFVLFSAGIYAQTDTICGSIPYKDGKVCYEGVVQADKLTAESLYNNAKIWIANNFGSAKSVIQTDIPNSSIVIKGVLKEDGFTTYNFTLTLQFKDNRYKYILTDLVYHFMSVENPVEEQPFMKSCIETTVNEFNDFFAHFLNRVNQGIIKDNDW